MHPFFQSWQRTACAIAVVGVLVCALAAWSSPASLWRAYLAAYMACWPVTLGAAGLVAIGNLTGGRWATAARPLYLSAARTMPLMAILFLPIALSLDEIYPWFGASAEGGHSLPPHKAFYFAPHFFLWRAMGYLAVWLLVIGLLNYVSHRRHASGSTPAMRRVGALALVLLAPSATFAAFDWSMSLEPEWYSSIYGAIVIVGGVLAAHAVAVCGLAAADVRQVLVEPAADGTDRDPANGNASSVSDGTGEIYGDFGNLLLTFLMLFGYFAFSQFLIIWSGNLPGEISWYLRRLAGVWPTLALLFTALGFIAFFQLLSRERKRTASRLAMIAITLLAMYAVHHYWMVVLAFPESGWAWTMMNIAAMVSLGGFWTVLFCWHANRNLGRRLAASRVSDGD